MRIASPKATASSTLPPRALGPRLSTTRFTCSGSRSENITSWPAFTHRPPSVEPMRPESVAGDLIAELKLRERLFVATKVWTRGREEGMRQMETSFKRLRVDTMDLMQVHNLVDVAVHAVTLRKMKEESRVRYIGVTHY